jgi:hypothetical protein
MSDDGVHRDHKALFLFGDAIAEYLAGLYKKAIRLHYVAGVIASPEARTRELVDEDAELLLWFSEQYEEARRQFSPYLYIGKNAG